MYSSFFQRHLFISPKLWLMIYLFIFSWVLTLDSVMAFHCLDFSETKEVHQVKSVGNCHPDISVFTWLTCLPNLGFGVQRFSLCFSWLLICSTEASAFSSEVFVTLTRKWCGWTPCKSWSLGFDENSNRAPLGKGSNVLVQEEKHMKEHGRTVLFCRLEKCTSSKQMLRNCFKHLEVL